MGSWGNLRTLKALAPNSRLARQTAPVEAATWDELRLVLRRVEPVPQAMLLLQWWAGMRSGEARLMRPCEIDRIGPVWIYRPSEHKNAWRGQERNIPLGPKCQAVLGRFVRHGRQRLTSSLLGGGHGRTTTPLHLCPGGPASRRSGWGARFSPLSPSARCQAAHHPGARPRRGQGHPRAQEPGHHARYAAGIDLQTAVDAARDLS
jgi:integrase